MMASSKENDDSQCSDTSYTSYSSDSDDDKTTEKDAKAAAEAAADAAVAAATVIRIDADTVYADDVVRIHIPAIPHTLTNDDYSHCPFTGKVARMAPMLARLRDAAGARRYEVWHYGVEGSAPTCGDVHVQLFTRDVWLIARRLSYAHQYPDRPQSDLDDPHKIIFDQANYGTLLYMEFNARLRRELRRHYRDPASDLVLLPFGPAHEAAIAGWSSHKMTAVESGIGYSNPFHAFRIYESATWQAWHQGREQQGGEHYHFVIPNYYDPADWPLSPSAPPRSCARPLVGFLGRICDSKGIRIILRVARRTPDVDYEIVGQGDVGAYEADAPANVRFLPPLQGRARATFLGTLSAFLAPSLFAEPFLGAAVEAQLCGIPCVTTAYGAVRETVEHGKTGMLCHTIGDIVRAVRLCVDNGGAFDRAYVRDRAVRLFGYESAARRYDAAFQQLLDLARPGGGWNTRKSHMLLDFAV